MMMMIMANQAEPLDSSCTNTKYMSWEWRNGLEGVDGTRWLHTAAESSSFMLLFSGGNKPATGSSHFHPFTEYWGFTGSWSLA